MVRFFFSRKLLRFALTLTIFLVTMVVAAWLVLNPILRWRLQTAAEDTLAGTVTVKEAGIDFLHLGVWGKGIVVSSPPGFREPYVVKIGRVVIRTSPISWLAGSVDIDSVEAWDTDLRIEISEKGTNISFLGREGQSDGQKRALLLKKCVFHNSSVTIADRDNMRIVFTDVFVEFEDASFFKGEGHATNVRAKSLLKGRKSNASLELSGSLGPIGDSINFNLNIDVKQLDLRDFEAYFKSDPSKTFGSPRINITGKLVCKNNLLDGTQLIVRASTGEGHPINLTGPIDNPGVTSGTKIANILGFLPRKLGRFLHDIFD